MKSKVAMKFFKDIQALQNKITEMVKQLSPEVIKSITGYDVYTKTFFEYF